MLNAYALLNQSRHFSPGPAGFIVYLDSKPVQVCCCSPERLLRGSRGGLLEARPIKGTAARHADPERDAAAVGSLAASAKDCAENLMIVDLLRNDLGRVCQVCLPPSPTTHLFSQDESV
jgi:para-aminobenzoate synthetase